MPLITIAANTSPIFALKPETKANVKITTAETTKDGSVTTNLKDIVTGSTDGTKVTWVKFKFVGTSTAGIFMLFITDTAGANHTLFYEQTYSAVSSSSTATTAEGTITFNDLQLKSGQKLVCGATTVNTNIHVTASIGDFS